MASSSLSTDEKLDFLIEEVKKLQKNTSEIAQLVSRVNTLEATVKEQASTISTLQKEVRHLKDHTNFTNQQTRALSLRLYNFPGSDSETGLINNVYDKVLKPLLVAGKAGGHISAVPQVGNTLTSAYRIGKFSPGVNKPPPPIILKFVSLPARLAILKSKRLHMPPPPEGAKRYMITEDLTPATHKKFKELLGDQRVEKLWTVDGVIWVVPVATKVAIRVKSVFDSNSDILK